jgi:hypothetical protein
MRASPLVEEVVLVGAFRSAMGVQSVAGIAVRDRTPLSS